MKQSEIESIIEKRFEKLNTAFDNVRMQLDEENIRSCRVKIKKLAAWLQLFSGANGHSHQIKLPDKIAKAYGLLGAIREIHIQQSHIQKTLKGKQILPPVTYLKLISDSTLQRVSDFNKHIEGLKSFKKDKEKLSMLIPKHLSQKMIEQFVQSEGNKAKKLLTPVFPSEKSFHETRKYLKALLYISPCLTEEGIITLLPYAPFSTYDDIHAFTTLLGAFHDLNTAINRLHKECEEIEIDENEKTVLRHIETLWTREREAFRIKIFDEIEKITVLLHPVESMVNRPAM